MLHTPHTLANENRKSDHRPLNEAEWTLIEPFVVETPRRPGRPPRNHRLVLDGIFWVACTGSPWRGLPAQYGNWGSVYRQFLRWTKSGLWAALLETLENTATKDARQSSSTNATPDRTTLADYIKQAQLVALRPRSTQGRSRGLSS